MTVRQPAVHYAPPGRKRTACGRPVRQSKRDSAKREKVTCGVCKRCIRAWERYCRLLND